MTIGVVNELRGKGVSKLMLDNLKGLAEIEPLVSYIYLHVVEYNNSGIKFYKKNGFI